MKIIHIYYLKHWYYRKKKRPSLEGLHKILKIIVIVIVFMFAYALKAAFRSVLPVTEQGLFIISSGVPSAIISPPSFPPSGPRSMTQSDSSITSSWCSITTTVFPILTRWSKTFISLSTSWGCSPVVGSSKRYRVLPAVLVESSLASFSLWASPPKFYNTSS